VNPATLTVTATSASRIYGAANPAFGYTISGFVNGNNTSVISGSATETTTVTSTSAPGNYPISFSAQGLTAANYNFNYVGGTLTVTQASQTISFPALSNVYFGSAPVPLAATASSGLAVSYSSLTPSVCTVSGTNATLLGNGTCTIQAAQAGNANYSAATSVSQSFTVSPAFTITPNPGNQTVTRGVFAGFVLQLNAGSSFSGNVTLSCSGGPAGAQCGNLPQVVNPSSNGTAYALSGILFPANTTPGNYAITFTGTSGSVTSSATATFTVTE
jgi:hypothetical protein